MILAGGFALQAIGYPLEIAGVETAGGTTLLVALATTRTIAVGAFALYSRLRSGRVDRLFEGTNAATQDLHREEERKRKEREEGNMPGRGQGDQ